MRILLLLTLLLFSLSGCIEIIEDLTLNSDRSGSYKLTVNLSASKMKVKSLLSMDSLRGRSVPSETDIQKELTSLTTFLNSQNGLSNAKTTINFDDLICKISFDFETLEDLQKGIHTYAAEKAEKPLDFISVFELSPDYFKRNTIRELINEDWTADLNKEDMNQLKESSLVLITRFDKPLAISEEPSISISKNKMASMYRTTLFDLIEHQSIDEYTLLFTDK